MTPGVITIVRRQHSPSFRHQWLISRLRRLSATWWRAAIGLAACGCRLPPRHHMVAKRSASGDIAALAVPCGYMLAADCSYAAAIITFGYYRPPPAGAGGPGGGDQSPPHVSLCGGDGSADCSAANSRPPCGSEAAATLLQRNA